MKTIAILYGGKSGEHEVSLISASSIIAFLDKAQYSIIPIGITKDGQMVARSAYRYGRTALRQKE